MCTLYCTVVIFSRAGLGCADDIGLVGILIGKSMIAIVKLISVVTLLLLYGVGSAQVDVSPIENQYTTINRASISIEHNGIKVLYGESFKSVSKKWSDAIYAGVFDSVYNAFDESYFEICDYKIIFDDAYFFFEKGKLAYFIIESKNFIVQLNPSKDVKQSLILRVGKTLSSDRQFYAKSFNNVKKFNKSELVKINIGRPEPNASPIYNDLNISINKSTNRIKSINYYGLVE